MKAQVRQKDDQPAVKLAKTNTIKTQSQTPSHYKYNEDDSEEVKQQKGEQRVRDF